MFDEAGLPAGESGKLPRRPRARAAWPLAALLFAPASVFAFMANNLNQTAFRDVAPSLVGAIGFAALAWLAVAAARRRADIGAAVIAAIWVAGALFFHGLFGEVNKLLDGGYAMVHALPVALAALALASYGAHRLPARWLRPVHSVLTGIAVVLLATPLWEASAYAWRHGDARAAYDPERAAADLARLAGAEAAAPAGGTEREPDIYHFIFDRYGSAETLSRHYGVEGSIGDFLEERGFYVARDSYSNYLKTGPSLASTFYMDYLDLLAEDPRVEGANWHPIFAMLDDHRVGRFLHARGYRFLQFGSWWVGTYDNPAADENHPHGFSEFGMLYLRRTILLPIFHALPDTPLTMRLDWDNAQCQRVARQIEEIKAIGERETPVYVFAHILVPHGPHVFAPDGRCLSRAESVARGETQGFADQVVYASALIRDIVGALQAEDRAPPVILIQADEGPFPERDYSVPWQEAPAEELRVKTGILNAFYFPDGDYSRLRPDISPVNSYRAVFNSVFGTSFAEIPDRIFAFPFDANLYEFHDVTDRVRSGLAHAGAEGQAPM